MRYFFIFSVLVSCISCQLESASQKKSSAIDRFKNLFEDQSFKGDCYENEQAFYRDYIDVFGVNQSLKFVTVPFQDEACTSPTETAVQDQVEVPYRYQIGVESNAVSGAFEVDLAEESGQSTYTLFKITDDRDLYLGKATEADDGTTAEKRPKSMDESYRFFDFTEKRTSLHEQNCTAQGEAYLFKNGSCKTEEEFKQLCLGLSFKTEWRDQSCVY